MFARAGKFDAAIEKYREILGSDSKDPDALAPIRKLFLLDSGGFNNLISLAMAREVTKVHVDSGVIVKGVSGAVKEVYRADKATLEFGKLRQRNEDLVAFDLTPISESAGTEIAGILGFAMLRLLEIKIEYRDGLIDFNCDPKRWGK